MPFQEDFQLKELNSNSPWDLIKRIRIFVFILFEILNICNATGLNRSPALFGKLIDKLKGKYLVMFIQYILMILK